MPNLLTDAQAGSEVPSLAVNAGLPTLLVLTGPCAPIRRIAAARPLKAGAILVATVATIVLLRRAWSRRRGIPLVPVAELARRREAWEASHPLWPITCLPWAIGCAVSAAEARAGVSLWLLRGQDWQPGIDTGIGIGFRIWFAWLLRRI